MSPPTIRAAAWHAPVPATAPRVSVITIFRDGEAFLGEAIESVIGQTFEQWELLLVDDGSAPPATATAKAYAARYPGRIAYFEHAGHANRGMSATRNLGVRHARGELIAFIDADDVWLPSKLADQVALLDAHPDVGMVCGAVVYWRSWSGGEDTTFATGHAQNRVVAPPEAAFMVYPLGKAMPPCPSDILVRKSRIEELGGFEEHFTAARQYYEDQGFFAKLYLVAPVLFSSTAWLKYRIHPASCSALLQKDGGYHDVRRYFLTWFESYLEARPDVDGRVRLALGRAFRPYRRPRLDFVLTIHSRLYAWLRRKRAELGLVGRRRIPADR